MRTFGRILGRGLLVVILTGIGLYVFGPYERISLHPTVTEADIGADVDAYFATQEARFDDLTPGVEKRVVWHGVPGTRTPLAIVYVHGFSATSEEIRPVPDLVAAALGANLIYTRLQGHGRDGAALAAATVQGWTNDVAEALIVARRVADEVVIISTSTGGTVVAGMAEQPDVMHSVTGMIFVSPNFGINNPMAPLLTLPAARHWVPLVGGEERSFEAANAEHAKYWTTSYPTTAVLQMAELVKQVSNKAFSTVAVPALFWFSEDDKVVRPDRTHAVAAAWGGDHTVAVQSPETVGDPSAHLITGDIMSPENTQRSVDEFVLFIKNL